MNLASADGWFASYHARRGDGTQYYFRSPVVCWAVTHGWDGQEHIVGMVVDDGAGRDRLIEASHREVPGREVTFTTYLHQSDIDEWEDDDPAQDAGDAA